MFAYAPLCSVDAYLQQLVAVSSLQDDLITYLDPLKNILANKSCAVRTYRVIQLINIPSSIKQK